jgi:hypothetical protein
MNFLLNCALDKVYDKMSLYDYSNRQLANKVPDIDFMVLNSTRTSLYNDIADVAKALLDVKTIFFRAKISHDFEVSFKTIFELIEGSISCFKKAI